MRYRHIATGEVVRLANKTARGVCLVDVNGNRIYITDAEFAVEYRALAERKAG